MTLTKEIKKIVTTTLKKHNGNMKLTAKSLSVSRRVLSYWVCQNRWPYAKTLKYNVSKNS